MTGLTNPTPSELRALAARAEELAAETDAVHAALGRAGDEPTPHAGFRLSEGAGHVRQAAQDLAEPGEASPAGLHGDRGRDAPAALLRVAPAGRGGAGPWLS